MTLVCLAALASGTILMALAAARHMGLPRHTARVIAVSVSGGLLIVLLDQLRGRRLDAWLNRVGRRTLIAGSVAAVVSGLLYSVVHEFGHVIFAVALGGTVQSVTWTIFGSTPPQVFYSHLPPRADPWAAAGGYLFPTAVALLLIAAWYLRRRYWSSLATAVLLIPAATMLLPNLGCLPELSDWRSGHFGVLASYYEIGRMGKIFVSLLFAGASMTILIAMLSALKNTERAPED